MAIEPQAPLPFDLAGILWYHPFVEIGRKLRR